MAQISTAPIQALADGGFMVTLTATGTPAPRRLPVSVVAAGLSAATTALQPEQVGSAIYERSDAYVRVSDYDAAIAARDATIADLITRMTAVENLIESGVSVAVFEAGVYESGVFI